MSTPEIKQDTGISQPEQVVTVIPESINTIPREVEAAGVKATPSQITAQVTDDTTGKPMMQSPATQKITVTLPASTQQLTVWSQGSPSEALTWLAGFWLRLVKKAIYFGWNVVGGGEPQKT